MFAERRLQMTSRQEHRLRILALGALLTLVKSLEVKAQGSEAALQSARFFAHSSSAAAGHVTPPRGGPSF